jgi:cellulose synthase (UDP-forming)
VSKIEPFYFQTYENRQPEAAVPERLWRTVLFQWSAAAALGFGAYYIYWRSTSTINWNVPWLSIPLLIAESAAFIGSVLFFLSTYHNRDPEKKPTPISVNDILQIPLEKTRLLIVDIFIATYNEDVELVRLSIQDAKKIVYPNDIDVRIHVLDDGRRESMKLVTEEENVFYITRATNTGFKAGNLRNAMEQTTGDLVVICDADTRLFPTFLENTLGYFRDPNVAWVQTPQWFYDLQEGIPLVKASRRVPVIGTPLSWCAKLLEIVFGPIRLNTDPFANDPQLFFDVIQRRRNWCNASFCCGAGSIHRREAVLEAALRAYGRQIDQSVSKQLQKIKPIAQLNKPPNEIYIEAARAIEFTPYKFHVSEDIYTSLMLHSDEERSWRSIYHPEVLSKMLSPQDLLAWTVQRFKYAGGTLDIFAHDNPLTMKGLSFWQKIMYAATVYSYFSPLWIMIFLLSPIVYMFTGAPPLTSYGLDFYVHFIPFIVMNKIAFMLLTWGISTWRGEQYYTSFFYINLKAMWDVIRQKQIKFVVTPKVRQSGNYISLVWPHIVIVLLTLIACIYRGYYVGLSDGETIGPFVVNLFWSIWNIISLSVIISAAFLKPTES